MLWESAESQKRRLERLEEMLWVTEAQAGGEEAFGKLLRKYDRPLLYYLRRLVPNAEAALDLHQEVWVEAFRGLNSLRAPEAFRAWLYRIAHNKAARFVRNEVRHEEVVERLAGEVDERIEIDAEAIHHGLDRLPVDQREVLTLHYLRDLSTQEIGAVLGCPPGTVKSRLHNARKSLRRLLERNL
jgi:RNA polymerase sigma-70 factor (ECF subfamily)